MIVIKILGLLLGMASIFGGFYVSYGTPQRREVPGYIIAFAGLVIFSLSIILIFVPGFFG